MIAQKPLVVREKSKLELINIGLILSPEIGGRGLRTVQCTSDIGDTQEGHLPPTGAEGPAFMSFWRPH